MAAKNHYYLITLDPSCAVRGPNVPSLNTRGFSRLIDFSHNGPFLASFLSNWPKLIFYNMVFYPLLCNILLTPLVHYTGATPYIEILYGEIL